MASEKQRAASRANGAKSRGPVTPEGRLSSARRPLSRINSERGMLASTVVLDVESRPRFRALLTSLQEELKPETPIENLLIHKMAVAHWRLMRAWGMERSCANQGVHESEPPGSSGVPTSAAAIFRKSGLHLTEYEMRFDRQFTRNLDRYERFRATRTRHVQQTKAEEPQR
jgi:hypothetical protein